MSAFSDVIHKVAVLGEHTIEYVEGHHHITLNGAIVAAEDVVKLLEALAEVAPLLGVAVPTGLGQTA
ncbi:hypothetical protein [Streptomyces collinus]|uniref:Uncharacterized protein n=1 Tax=Streptomyces collinus (strain DSM 40733 / Tue 365) TaxID=1214242 RepID=S5VSY7_STRC3|nr:hypothetical protein [Streptomyces collinus]AGS73952.1 hypothetical protein B446_35968 [Streptomyces collinus Tu 365]